MKIVYEVRTSWLHQCLHNDYEVTLNLCSPKYYALFSE